MPHALLSWFEHAAGGEFPVPDGRVTYLPPFDDGREAVVSFTGHAVVASRFGAPDLADLRPDGFGQALRPELLLRLMDGGTAGMIDVTLCAEGLGGQAALALTTAWDDHPRVHHARDMRRGVEVRGDERGFITLADGLAGRREMSFELSATGQGAGLGRVFAMEARRLTPHGTWLFAAASPGNARSLRALLAAGFRPIGSEVIVTPTRSVV